jgi:hypothetical protein
MSERLKPLLEWINVDREAEEWNEENVEGYRKMTATEVRRRVTAFVRSFDGPPLKHGRVTWPEDANVDVLRAQFTMCLSGGEMAPSVRLRVLRRRDGQPALDVSGEFPDVALYLAARLVADEQIELTTCVAPAAGLPGRAERDWSRWPICGRSFVVTGRGNLKRYCSKACKARAKNPNWQRAQKGRK